METVCGLSLCKVVCSCVCGMELLYVLFVLTKSWTDCLDAHPCIAPRFGHLSMTPPSSTFTLYTINARNT